MKIQMIEGLHMTAVDKKGVKAVIQAGRVFARNSVNTKTWDVIAGWVEGGFWHYQIKIGSFATYTIGAAPRWQYSTVVVKTDKKQAA